MGYCPIVVVIDGTYVFYFGVSLLLSTHLQKGVVNAIKVSAPNVYRVCIDSLNAGGRGVNAMETGRATDFDLWGGRRCLHIAIVYVATFKARYTAVAGVVNGGCGVDLGIGLNKLGVWCPGVC